MKFSRLRVISNFNTLLKEFIKNKPDGDNFFTLSLINDYVTNNILEPSSFINNYNFE